jgi:hypothetical protein
MSDDEKAFAVADAFNALRAQRKARRKAELPAPTTYWTDRADTADKLAVEAVEFLLRTFGR